jgi:hypothetical protein
VYNEAITDLLGGGKVDLRTSVGGKIILQGAAEVKREQRLEHFPPSKSHNISYRV